MKLPWSRSSYVELRASDPKTRFEQIRKALGH